MRSARDARGEECVRCPTAHRGGDTGPAWGTRPGADGETRRQQITSLGPLRRDGRVLTLDGSLSVGGRPPPEGSSQRHVT